MIFKRKIFLSLLPAIFVLHLSAFAQFEKIADETIAYLKAGTFGKPDVIKKTAKDYLRATNRTVLIIDPKATNL